MLVVKLTLVALHFAALSFFALKYLRFDVKSRTGNVEDNSEMSPSVKVAIDIISKEIEKAEIVQPTFDRFVFFLLDAWRWDFLFNERSEMKYLQSKIMNGEAIGLVSLARIPTVTKPCIKSIFAGSQPVFFEIVENIDESGVTETVTSTTGTSQDNLLRRLRASGKTVSVYGDDVWGKLFPMSTFHRHDLAFGFNIMDYTNVDNLVHRGFEIEKGSSNISDVIILHYLGLDHIGHSFSAKSEYVDPKLREMDGKVQEIYDWITQKDSEDGKKTLLLMMGDHGMTRDGNHGGGSKDETQAAAVFMSPHFGEMEKYKNWKDAIKEAELDYHNQEDIAATLTALLDGTNPLKFGNGCLINRVMKASARSSKELVLLLKNLRHLLEKSHANAQIEKLLTNFTFPFLSVSELEGIYKVSVSIKNVLNSDNFAFDEQKLKIAVLVLALVALLSAALLLRKGGISFSLETAVTIVSVSILAACQSATSFIGEEHLLWQGAFTAALLTWALKSLNSSVMGVVQVLLIHRILCGWNGIGTIWANDWTFGSWIKSHDILEGISVALALSWIIIYQTQTTKTISRISLSAQVTASLLVLLHRIGFKALPSYQLAQTVLLILATDLFIVSKFKYANLKSSAAILFVLVNKPFNALPIALILCLAEGIVALESDLGPASVFLQMCAMQCAYYSLGLWNSVSAIDLTFGAVFTKNFDMKVAPVVLLIYCWSGPILVALILRKKRKADFSVELTFLRSILDCTACAFAYHHRFHPWIFDFFSPKILFQVFWALFFLLLLPLIQLLI